MIKHFQVISISFEKIDTEYLDQFLIKYSNTEELSQKLNDLKKSFDINELQYLSTCNRLMILIYRKLPLDFSLIKEILLYINPDLNKDLGHNIKNLVDFYTGKECISHVFEIVSSLRSLVLGERQIFRQYRKSFEQCSNMGLIGKNLRLLEKNAVLTAKDVFTSTQIGAKPTSIVSLAVQKLMDLHPNVNSKIIMVGSGETNTTVGRFLKKYGFQNITIFNRSLDNAKVLSKELNAKAMHISELRTYNEGFDILICCTAATAPIITTDLYRRLIGDDNSSKILIDLSIPNNIAKNVKASNNATLINIDSLKDIAQQNLKARMGNVAASRILINLYLDLFIKEYNERQMIHSFKALPSEINSIKDKALNVVFQKDILNLPEETKHLLHDMMNYMEKKCIAAPIKMVKQMAAVENAA